MTVTAIFLAMSRVDAARREIVSRSRPTEIVVASRPIHAGEPFSLENLSKKSIPISGTGRRNIPASEFDLLLQAKCKGEIDPGEPVLWTDVEEPFESEGFSGAIEPGQRAMTLEANATSSFSGLIRTGDRIDLLCSPGEVWIRNLRILAVDRQYNRSGAREESETSNLTLSVTDSQGTRLADCLEKGKISWFLRNPEDNQCPQPARRRQAASRVEIYKAGIPESPGPLFGVGR